MIKLGLIGNPIAHSFSPEIHQGFITEAEMQGSYDLFEMDALPEEGLKTFMQHHGLVGLNVTIPFKEEVFNALDSVDDVAKTLGVVNTVVLEKDRLIGYNTDVYGIQKSLTALGCPPCKALVCGSGGAAKAVSKVLKDNGFEVIILSRGNTGASYDGLSEEVAADCKLWVNCTPVGTEGIDPHLLPLPYAVLSEEFAIFDLVYKPNPTPLMKEGLQRGTRVLGGEKMLIEQAKKSWQLFHDAYYKNL
jgi:shikimate dehydrogenase